MSFTPQSMFTVEAAETALVGWGIGEEKGEKYKYTGVNSMVGTLISWGKDNYTTTKTTVGSWYIDNNGYIAWGSSGGHRNPDITYAVPKNSSLSKIELIKAQNGGANVPNSILTANGTSVTIDNLVKAGDGKLGAYFTVGAPGRTSTEQMAEDWAKAIVAASHYSKSGILQNAQFGSEYEATASTEFPEYDDWASDYNKYDYGGFGKQQNKEVANNTYIYIKLMADWEAPIVNTMTTSPTGTQTLPGDPETKYVDRFVKEARNKTAEEAEEEAGVQKARDEGFFEFDFGSNGGENSLQMGTNGSKTEPSYQKGKDEGATKESGPHFSLGTSFSGENSISNLYHDKIHYNQFSAVPSEEPFSFGRLAIPDNCYVIVDLNGHTLDRNLDDPDLSPIIHQNVICPSVFLAGLYSRLEVFDSSASEKNPAGEGKIMGALGINGDGIIDGCPPDYVSRAGKPAWNVDAWGNSLKGGGVKLGPRAEFTLHSGTITENSAVYGGAVYGTGNNYIYIYDGVMTGNTACKGGATYLSSDSQMVFNMFGGSISGNGADWRRFTRYIHVKDTSQVKDAEAHIAIPDEWQTEGVGTGFRGFGVNEKGETFDKAAWSQVVSYSTSDGTTGYNVKSGEINSEGGGVCVFKNTYFNMYGGSIAYNYSYEYAGGVNINNLSFFKMYGGEITENVVTGEVREITGGQISEKEDDGSVTTKTPEANVGGGGVNMFQDSAGIYLNGPGRITDNHTCNTVFDYNTPFSAAKIAEYLTTNSEQLADSNLYLSLTKSDHTQVTFEATKHLYPEIKVQGPLYRDADHFAQVSITPAAGIEAGGYIMRQFLKNGWEDGVAEQNNESDGSVNPKWLGSAEKDHAKDQIGEDGTTAFNVSKYLSTGATTGYVDGFLFTDGGTSIVEGASGTSDEGWYLALGTKDSSNLPVEWQYYDNTLNEEGLPKGWTKAETTAETGTGFSLVYNGEDRKENIRVRLDRSELVGTDEHLSKYFYLYYDYYTTYEPQPDGSIRENPQHYYYDDGHGGHANILEITSGHYLDGDRAGEPIEQKEAKYVSERYDRLGYRFTINENIKNLSPTGGDVAPFHSKDTFHANPNYATMKIERATLMISQLTLTDVDRYYDGTTDFYIPSEKISAGEITGYAAKDQIYLRMQFVGMENEYVKGTLQNPNVGTTNVQLSIYIEEVGRGADHTHDKHDERTFPDECLLLNYKVYDQNSGTTTDAEDKGNIPVTLNVNIQPKPITVTLAKQTYEYGSVPMFGEEWGTHAGQANWAETYAKANGGTSLQALFEPKKGPAFGEEGFDPDALGKDGALAQVDIDSENVDSEHGAVDKSNLALRLDQILKISFISAYTDRSPVGTYGGAFSYTNTNYAVTWVLDEQVVSDTPASVEGVIGIAKRRISATVSDAASIYGETRAELTLLPENVKHIGAEGMPLEGDEGIGIVFDDRLGETLDLTDAVNVRTTGSLRVTVDADSRPVNDGKSYYTIDITNKDSVNENYELVSVTTGKYTVYPRKIVLKANPYSSVYGDAVAAGMGGYASELADTQFGSGLSHTSTVIFESDRTAFGKGISYEYTDELPAHTNKGEYPFNVRFDHTKATEGDEDIGINYAVEYGDDATHTVDARQVSVVIYSPEGQRSEYGEEHTVQQGTGSGVYWYAQSTSNGDPSVVVLDADRADFVAAISLYISEKIGIGTPVGTYPIMGRYTPKGGNENYTVDFIGSWEGEAPAGYDDETYGSPARRAGTYTITRRNIELNISVSLASEYGDDLVKFWEGTAYTLSRPDGKPALVNEDVLTFDPSLFYIQVSSSQKIVGGDENVKFEKNRLQADTYSVIFDGTAYRSSPAYNEGVNANYAITENRGRYTVDKRAIQIVIGATADGGFQKDARMEYGGVVPARMAQITRTGGKEGDGFIGDDGAALTAYLATENSIGNYSSSLSGSGHLRVGTYTFTALQNDISNNYAVTWEYGTLQVEAREVQVRINRQEVAYTGNEPNVSNSEWTLANDTSLASGDLPTIVALDKVDGADAGKYDISLTCSDSNYHFVIVDDTDKGAFVITPAVITVQLSGENEIVYDKASHLVEIEFGGDGLTPVRHLFSSVSPTDRDGKDVYTFADYTVIVSYSGAFGTSISASANHANVGTYTLQVILNNTGTFGAEGYSGNYCFTFIEEGGSTYEQTLSYNIIKATIGIEDLAPLPYNRKTQTAVWSFVNAVHPNVVPDAENYSAEKGNIKYAIKMDGDAQADANSRLEGDLPYYKGEYTFTLTLTEEDFRNYRFESTEQSIVKDFKITPLEVLSGLSKDTEEYDDKTRFHVTDKAGRNGALSFVFAASSGETPVTGIGYNVSYTYTGWGKDGTEEGEHTLLVKVGGYLREGSDEREPSTYFVDDGSIEEGRMWEILSHSRAFIDAGTYTIRLSFEYENFLLRDPVGSETMAYLDYTYTITPVLLSTSAFDDKEFNNQKQEPEITASSFTPTSEMTGDTAFGLLKKEYNGYTLSYTETEMLSSNNAKCVDGKPFNAGTYTVTITLNSHNFAFSKEASGGYVYEDSTQRFIIEAFDIGTTFSRVDEHGADHAFDGVLDGKLIDRDHIQVYSYSYTGQEIMPNLIRATIRLTSDGDPISYEKDEIGANFQLGTYIDNIYADAAREDNRMATLTVSGIGNYTGTTNMSFSITPMELTAKVGRGSGVYGETLAFDEATLISYLDDKTPFAGDKMFYRFELAGTEGKMKGEHVFAGDYALVATCENVNYNVTFTGDWHQEGDDGHNGTCGIYTVAKRQITVVIDNQTFTYSGKSSAPALSSTGSDWTANFVLNGRGDPIVAGDTLTVTLSVKDAPAEWNAGTYTIEGVLVETGDGANYEVSSWTEGTLTISAIRITVTIKPQTSEYDGEIPVAQQGEAWYTVTYGEAASGDDLADIIRLSIVNPEKNARQYQLTGESTSDNYIIDFGSGNYYTVTPRRLSVAIKDASSYYGETEVELNGEYYTVTHNGETENAIVKDDDLNIALTKEAGTDARAYNITGSWNRDPNYDVTFTGDNRGTMGTYTVKRRPVTVNINDQDGVYGSIGNTELSQDEGERAAWYVVGLTRTEEGLTPEILVVGSDVLGVTLKRTDGTAPGDYKITGSASNANYEVTFTGAWSEADADQGRAGVYRVAKRAVTVTVLAQTGVYGNENPILQGEGSAYTAVCTNATSGSAFVRGDNVRLTVSVMSKDTVGKSPIVLKIEFGSNESYYDITVETEGRKQDDGTYQVAEAYTLEPRKLRVTISDLTSVYGEIEQRLAIGTLFATNTGGGAILDTDDAAVRAAILSHLSLVGEERLNGFLQAGRYAIEGTNFTTDDGHYEIEFTGSREDSETGFYTVETRNISVSIQNAGSTYGDIGDYVGDDGVKAELDARLAADILVRATNVGSDTDRTQTTAIGEDDLDIKIFLMEAEVSGSKHLKVKQYIIFGSASGEANIVRNYTVSFLRGTYTVEARQITVTLGTNAPSSEYGDAITSSDEWGWSAALTYGGEGQAVLEGDNIEFTMSTTFVQGNDVGSRDITATETVRDGNDNGNYNIVFRWGTYRIVPREIEITVKDIAPVVYGTAWKQPEYDSARAGGKEGDPILNGEVSIKIDVQGADYSATHYLRYRAGGYNLTASVEGEKQGNYNVKITNISAVKYTVEKRPITIKIENATSVYGDAFLDGGKLRWTVALGEIVKSEDGMTSDDLQIAITKESGRNVGDYALSGECRNADYAVSWQGDWDKAGDDAHNGVCGIYTVTKRSVRVNALDQDHAVYGEVFGVYAARLGVTVEYAVDTLNELAAGDEMSSVVRLYILVNGEKWNDTDKLDATLVGGYPIRVEGINENYIIELGSAGIFKVAPREIRVRIADQHGVYGEANEVDQNRYTPENVNGTGKPIVERDSFTFTFSSRASEPKANVGSYPITGSAEATGETKASNYIITYAGSDGTAGLYTLSKRTIVVAITDQTAVYGGSGERIQLIPTLDVLYTATYNGVAENAILEGDDAGLAIQFELIYAAGKDLSTAGALKVGNYAIVGSYGSGSNTHMNYEVSFAGSWAGEENHSTAGTLRVDPRGITVALGMDGAVFSYYGDEPKGPWSEKDTTMYAITLTSGTGPAIVTDAKADLIEFSMTTLATSASPVGQYPLVGNAAGSANDNANYAISFTGGFSSSDDDYSAYSGLAGVYNVSPRQIKVTIKEYTREYGEDVTNSEVLSALLPDGSNGMYYTLPEGWSVNGYTAQRLGIVLDCVAIASSGAQTYTITGSESDPNYEVTFEGGEGKYVITQRTVYVVILPQVSVYGDPIKIDDNQTHWYAFRKNAKATWSNADTVDPNNVLAKGDKLDDLKVRLTKRGAVDGYEFNEGNGIYGGQYAIEGDYSNANYNVIFVGARTAGIFTEEDFKNPNALPYQYIVFTSRDTYDYEADPEGLLEKTYGTSGIYTIAPRSVSITLKSVEGTYGGRELTRSNDPLKKGVELDPAKGVVWDYTFGSSAEIDAGHIGYLSFYIGGKYAAELEDENYLTVASYPVVAYWGLGLEKSRVLDWNYKIEFYGEWNDTDGDSWRDENGNVPERGKAGKYTVSNATIEQAVPWTETLQYLMEPDAEPYTMSVNKSMTDLSAGKRYLTFKGDITEATSIEFGDLYHNETSSSKRGASVQAKGEYDADETTGAPKVKNVGYWIAEVTVKALYHEDATFDLVYHITPELIEITLENEVEYKFTYGTYSYDVKEDRTSFSALEAALKGWLLGDSAYGGDHPVVAALRESGAPVEAGNVAERLNALFLEPDVVVSIHKMASNRSTGGYLNASRYLITISGGANIGITFTQDYEVVVCEPKTVTATWEEVTGEAEKDSYKEDGADLFTVTYDGRAHTLTPTVTGVCAGDITSAFAAASYVYETEGGSRGAAATPLGYGYYVYRVTSSALGGADGGNYIIASNLHAYVSIEKRAIQVNIKDRAPHIYGDREQSFNDDDWDVDASTSLAYGDSRYMLGVTLTRAEGNNVGTYKVTGTSTNANYEVTFVGSWSAEGDGDSGHCGTFRIDPRPITVTLRDKSVVYGTAIPEGGDIASDITLWYATYDGGVAGIAIVQGDNIHLTMKISYNGEGASSDLTATGYLKAGTYSVVGGWTNTNYTVTFRSEARPASAQSQYEVTQRALRVSLFDAATTEYGYARPTETHAFTGFTERDEAYFTEHPDRLFIRFYFSTADGRELDPMALYDPVGTYAVRGEVTLADEIGENYDVNFVGGWDDNTYPELVQKAGVYRVIPRSISILIGSVESEYGEIAFIPITLQSGSPELVGSDTVEDLHITYKTEAYYGDHTNIPGTYSIDFDKIGNPNYRVNGAVSIGATYTVKPRKIKIVVDDQSGEYGDEHTVVYTKDVVWHSYWVTAEGDIRPGLGIVYEDDEMCKLRVRCTGLTAASPVGKYELSATYDNLNGCYDIVSEEYGYYNVTPRRIVVTVRDFTREYGEDHVTYFRNEINVSGVGFTAVRADGAAGQAVAFPTDPISRMHLALDVTRASHVGDYPITCVYEDGNYSVEVRGTYSDGETVGGTYRIDPREITVLLEDQRGEYGDDHTPVNRYGLTWSARRAGGGDAIVGSDDLGLTLSTNANADSPVGNYTITATHTNTDYEIDAIEANYTVDPRRLTASVYGESEYGDDLQETELVLSRTTAGLGGPGIMPWDDGFLTIEATHEAYKGAPVGHYPVTYTIRGDFNANENYVIVDGGKGEYVILPRTVLVEIGDYSQRYGDPTHENDIASFVTLSVTRKAGLEGEPILNNDFDIVLRVLSFSRNAGEYTIGIEEVTNGNYDVRVTTGVYTIERRAVTVTIDDKTSEYGSPVEALTTQAVEGMVEGDDLGLSLTVLWLDTLDFHNVGIYAIVGVYTDLNYLVTFEGSWKVGEAVGGTYTVYKAQNVWLKEYSGDGTVVQGNPLGEGEAPQAKFGIPTIRYYYDEACTQEIEGELSEQGVGVYYAKATVEDTLNYSAAETTFAIEVLSSFIYPTDTLDVSLFVTLFASQFVIGICALLFVRKRKNKRENKKDGV